MNEQSATPIAKAATPDSPPASHSGRNLLLIFAVVAALLVGLYAAAGFLWAPSLIDQQAKKWTREKLGLELALGDVKVDPFGFKVDISGIAIPAADPMVSVKALHLDFDIRSIFSESYRFDAITVDGPQVKAIVAQDGKLNLLKLMPPPNPDPLPPVLIADLKVTNGAAYLADLSKPAKPDTRLTLSRFELQNLHTTRDEGGGLRLAGISDQNEEFVWKGKVSMAPIASSGGLAIRGLKVASVHEFAGDLLPVILREGAIDIDLAYAASYGEKGSSLKAELPLVALSGIRYSGRPELIRADFTFGNLGITDTRVDVTIPPGGTMASTYSVGGIALRDARLIGTGPAAGEAVSLAAGNVDRIAILPESGRFSIGAIRLAGLDATTTRNPNGSIGLMALIPPSRTGGEGAAAMGMPAIGEVSLTGARLRLIDKAVRPATTWSIDPLTVSARGGETGTAPLKVNVQGRINGATPFSVAGDVDPLGATADVAVKLAAFPIRSAVPYTVDFPALEIRSGTASADGRLRYGPKAMGYTGAASIDDLRLVETFQKTDLVAWKRLALTGIDASPKRATIDRASLVAPYGSVTILQDGTLNFQRLVSMNPEPIVTPSADVVAPPKLTRTQRKAEAQRVAAEKKVVAAQAQAALAAPIVEPDIPVLVKRLDIQQGTLNFADWAIQPNFAAKVQGVNGSIANITNSPRGIAKVKLDGYVIDKFSPVTIAGELTPLQFDRRTRIDMAFRNIELPLFNPYSGRFAGYSIAKGKLTTELGYTIDNRKLDATHRIEIAQLEWGEATDSKEKVPLPLKLATSLMKDKNGVIAIDVPVNGTLDDPTFKMGPIIMKMLGNIIRNILTAPFKALGDLFGGKEDVQFVDFEPGSAAIPVSATDNLAGIAKGLSEKPELRLDIPSGSASTLDAVGLADQKIAAAAMAKEVKKGAKADLATLELDKRHDRLEDLYKVRFKSGAKFPEPAQKDEGDARKQRETDWLIAELRKSFAPSADELASLGKARAEAVRLALLEGATPVDATRVFLSGRESATDTNGKARMELKLET